MDFLHYSVRMVYCCSRLGFQNCQHSVIWIIIKFNRWRALNVTNWLVLFRCLSLFRQCECQRSRHELLIVCRVYDYFIYTFSHPSARQYVAISFNGQAISMLQIKISQYIQNAAKKNHRSAATATTIVRYTRIRPLKHRQSYICMR